MQFGLLAGTLVLAAVFATAGVAKLADLDGLRDAVAGFGVPRRYARGLGTALATAELVAALLLATRPPTPGLTQAGAAFALALIAVFSAAILVSLARGRAPECHCFGQLHSAPAGPRTLARNGGLLTLAAFVLSEGDPAWTGVAAIAGGAFLGLGGLLSRRAEARRRPLALRHGLPHGSPAPDFDLATVDGPPTSLDALRQRGKPVMLVFTASACGPCIALAPEIASWQRHHAERVTIAVIESRGDSPAGRDEHGRRDVLLEREREIADLYRAVGTPSAVLVDADGKVGSGIAAGRPAIEALLGEVVPGIELTEASARGGGTIVRLRRRELLAAGAAWAATATAIAPSAWATMLAGRRGCRYERCGEKCCPKKAKCRKRGGRRVCVCRDGREACGSRCCPETFVCRRRGRHRRRRCVCPEGYTECGGRCVRTRTDPRHCGRCGRECPTGTSCVDGDCVVGDGSGTGPGGSGACDCPPGKACCGGQCTDLNQSEEHCGDCGTTCTGGKTCCDGHCLELRSDPQNCGRCGRRCADNEVCSDGECRRRCRRGLKNCRGRCVDTSSDRSNCGKCGVNCGEGYACCNGSCCDYNASACCPSGCTNLALDDANCGECGNVCPPGAYCRFGTCTKPI